MGNILRVSHLCLKVSDINKAKAFYTGILGMTVASEGTLNGQPLVVLSGGLGLNECKRLPEPCSFDHIGLRVENMQSLISLLADHHIPIVRGPQVSPYGTSIYFQDPDGYLLECHDADRT